MNKKIISFMILFATINLQAEIKHIFLDIGTFVKTDTVKAAKYVGTMSSIQYIAKIGHAPNEADLFKALKPVPSKTTETTYNKNSLMPTIFSDWLLGLQKNNDIKVTVQNYLKNSSLSKIEKTIFENISNMMMTPKDLIDTLFVMKNSVKLVKRLKQLGYTVYLVGNWDAESQPLLLQLLQEVMPSIDHTSFSNQTKTLKPSTQYFKGLVDHYGIELSQCLSVEVEAENKKGASNAGMKTILFDQKHFSQLKTDLSLVGVDL